MPKLFLLFSHKLTAEQIADARSTLSVSDIVYLPEQIQSQWSQVPVEQDSLLNYALTFQDWLGENTQKDDYVLVQGDFGLSYLMVQWCLKAELNPIYATTRRVSRDVQQKDGTVSKTLVFQHQGFRLYEELKF